MPDVPYVIRLRERNRQPYRSNVAGRTALSCALVLSLLVSVAAVLSAYLYSSLTQDLPSLAMLPDLLNPPGGALLSPTQIYDRSGEHILVTLKNPGASDSQYLTLDASQVNYFPSELVTATIATVDPNFWEHAGFSFSGISQNSHPTLAQKLVSDLLLWDEPPSLRRALRERMLAAQITSRFGREQILVWYLNSANYGRLAFGADAASRVYFGKPAAELSLAESALLAAVAQAPALNPLDAEQAALENQNKVLNEMKDKGWISADQFEESVQDALKFSSPVASSENTAPAFVQLVLDQLGSRIDLSRLERGGLRVLTTLDYDLQLQASCAVESHLGRLSAADEETETLSGDECLAARLLPTIPLDTPFAPGDLAASAIVYDPARGEVLALVGETAPGLDPSFPPGRPGGTVLTPLIYLTAFARGLSPATLLWDIPSGNTISNPDGLFHGPIRLRTAMANDYLVPAARLLTQIGIDNVLETARQLGLDLETSGDQSPGSLLQQGKTTLLEISQAYGVFANEGALAGDLSPTGTNSAEAANPLATTILSVEDNLGRLWWGNETPNHDFPVAERPLINPQLAYLVTDVLKDEPARWPTLGHPNPLEIGRPVAAKIGQTQNSLDAWTVGYTPQVLAGVWLGVRNPEQGISQQLEVQPHSAAALWHALIQYASRDLPPEDWQMPEGISRQAVCNPSGLLPSVDCPDVVNEVFLTGTDPTQLDNLYKAVQINRETGRLATAFTPPELVEERTYLTLPPEAAEWARMADLPIPPQEYDIIFTKDGVSSDVNISSPTMLAQVGGDVPIIGTAGGEDFVQYRIQVGKGLNPRQWLQIGEDVAVAVEQGELGNWDTNGLDGLYTIQLQVIRQNQRVESATTQVTVDNQPPLVEIISPLPGQEAIPRTGQLIFLVEASDNLGVQSVSFSVDGKPLEERFDSPYAVSWESTQGEHTLQVVVTDQAGNETSSEVVFTVKE